MDDPGTTDPPGKGFRGPATGCLTFILAFFPCLILSSKLVFSIVGPAIEKMPRDEVYNALARDSEAVTYTAFSVLLAIAAAAAIAILAARCRRPNR
jgi:hypothetical protein